MWMRIQEIKCWELCTSLMLILNKLTLSHLNCRLCPSPNGTTLMILTIKMVWVKMQAAVNSSITVMTPSSGKQHWLTFTISALVRPVLQQRGRSRFRLNALTRLMITILTQCSASPLRTTNGNYRSKMMIRMILGALLKTQPTPILRSGAAKSSALWSALLILATLPSIGRL